MIETLLQHKGKIGAGLVLCSASLCAFIGNNEGIRHMPYRDSGGVWTVCDGHTGSDVVPHHYYTTAECAAFMQRNVLTANRGVLSCISVPISQNEFDAYSDLAYNMGVGGFCRKSGIPALVNAGKYAAACDRVMLFEYDIKGHYLAGLHTRREKERALCLKSVS